MDLKTIRNISPAPQQIVYKGQQIVLAEGLAETMDAGLADAFIEKCGGMIEVVEDGSDVFDPAGDSDVIWIANMTGDPVLADKLQIKQLVDKKWVITEIDNPAKKPHTLERMFQPGQVSYTGRDGGWMTKTLADYPVVIPPYKRRPFKKEIGEWFLRRTASSGAGYNQTAVQSRKPSAFEPDLSWGLDEMRAYLTLVSASKEKDLGSDQAYLEKTFKSEVKFEAAMREAKQAILKRIFYYVAKPAYRLPTRLEFQEFITGKPAEDILMEDAERLLEKAEASAF